jgi:hypothetical protein
MSGYKNYNFLNFFRAERDLIKKGYEVINPAREAFAMKSIHDYKDFKVIDLIKLIRQDVNCIMNYSDALYGLKGWEYSTGAQAEHALGKWCKKEIYYQSTL